MKFIGCSKNPHLAASHPNGSVEISIERLG